MLCFDPFAIDVMIQQGVIQLITEQFTFQWYQSTQAVP